MVLFFTHIPIVVNRNINATPPERLQQYLDMFTHTYKATLKIIPNILQHS